MSLHSKRKYAPLVALALAAPLAVPAASNAAIAGALAPNSTLAPDLVSATVTGVATSGTSPGTTVRYCFNKTLGSTPVATRFSVRTYENQALIGDSAAASGQCVDVLYGTIFDPSTYTTAGVAGDGTPAGAAVVNSATGTGNNADSSALIAPAPTNNGTRGRSTAPDLVGVSTGVGTVSYTFDEALAVLPAATAPETHFFVVAPNGATTPAAAGTPVTYSSDRKTVTATFPSISGAVRAQYVPTGTNDLRAAEAGGDPAPVSAAALPGSNGATTLADPIQGIIVGDGSSAQVDLVFDQPVTTPDLTKISLLLSNGSQVPVTAGSPAQPNTNTLRVTDSNKNRGEFIVGVVVQAAAVAGGNTVGTVPAGGNSGAFATGFTTGPDAVATTFDLPTNTATVTFDQRYTFGDSTKFRRVDNTGTVNNTDNATLSFGSTATPGRTTIQARFNSLAGTRALQILQGGVATALLVDPFFPPVTPQEGNVDQILAASASSAG